MDVAVISETVEIDTNSGIDIVDITALVAEHLAQNGIVRGAVLLFVPGSTGALTTIEYESGVIQDLADAIERLVPRDIPYAHDQRWGDGNGFSHVRAALLGPSLNIPLLQGRLGLGTWQQIVLINFDNRARRRRLIIQVMGEKE